MEYQNIINLLDNALSQPSKLSTTNWLNYDWCGKYNTNNQVTFETSMLKSNFCN